MQRNLLFISSYTGLGGGERIQLNLMEALDRDRYALHLAVPADGQFARAARDLGVTTHILPFRGATTWFVPAIWKRFPAARRLFDLVKEFDIHAIHSNYHALPFAVAAGHAARIPVLWYSIGWWFPVRPWQKRFFREQVTQIAAAACSVRDRWLGPSPFLPPESIPVIIPGVNADYFHPDIDGAPVRERLGIGPDVPLVVMLARFQQVKGHDIFQAMAQRIYAQMPEVRFAVAGENVFGVRRDETYKRAILDHAREDPVLSRCLTYLGHYDDPRPVVAAADVVVCPSRFESLGMVHLESMAMARPIVSTNNGGPAETVMDGVTGCLVPPEDPDALADRVLALLRDPVLRQRMGQAGRAHVLANFTASAYAAQISSLIETLMSSI
jgi:glycosyltransferase involved in cell wall biosynthesis